MVTELMGGGDVEGVIEKASDHRPSLEQAIGIARQTCRGPELTRVRGMVHRDLKPENVWLTGDGVARIGDFGLAVAIDRSRPTSEGTMVGTVALLSRNSNPDDRQIQAPLTGNICRCGANVRIPRAVSAAAEKIGQQSELDYQLCS